MVFCNTPLTGAQKMTTMSHNPYFNRWFSAIVYVGFLKTAIICHNPYFNRWFSAMLLSYTNNLVISRHNPYFNRWFSAIRWKNVWYFSFWAVTILILIDGFLQ